MFQEIAYHGATFGGEHALGVELDAVDVVLTMAERHDLSFVALGGDLQTVGEACLVDHPTVVSAHDDAAGQTIEDIVVGKLGALGCHAVEHFRQVGQSAAKELADGLVAEADAEHRLLAGIGLDDIEQLACL